MTDVKPTPDPVSPIPPEAPPPGLEFTFPPGVEIPEGFELRPIGPSFTDQMIPIVERTLVALVEQRKAVVPRVAIGPEGAVVLNECQAIRISAEDPRNLPHLEALTAGGWVKLVQGQRDDLVADLLELAEHFGEEVELVELGK